MKTDSPKTVPDAAERDALQQRLAAAEAQIDELKRRCDHRKLAFEAECADKHRAVEALQLANVILEHSTAILFRRVAGDDPKLVYVSANIAQFGYSAEDFLSQKIHYKDIVHPQDSDRVSQEIDNYTQHKVEAYTMVYRILTRDGETRWVEDRTEVITDPQSGKRFNQGIVIDITQRQEAELEVRRSEEKYRRIVETAAEGFLLMDQDLVITDVNAAFCHMTGFTRDALIGKTPLDLMTPKYRQLMLAKREELLQQDTRRFESVLLSKTGRQIPTLTHGSTLRDDQGQVIGHMAFVTDMTEHKKALELAGEVQKSLLPQKDPDIPGLDVAGRNISCEEIGGDYFDFLWQGQTSRSPLSVVVGDITGHGVDSALLMTTARAFLRMRASQPGSITDIVEAMNRHLAEDVLETGNFMTLFYLTIDHAEGRMEWIRAGHDPAIIYDSATDGFDELRGPGVALGVDAQHQYHASCRDGLAPGQIIAVGTDGIWEARNQRGQLFGKARFLDIIRRNQTGSAKDMLEAVFTELGRHTQGTHTEDDITLVIIKVVGP
jgi:sigma-B regulation protein RsbU (phosphoserine phosphatase)